MGQLHLAARQLAQSPECVTAVGQLDDLGDAHGPTPFEDLRVIGDPTHTRAGYSRQVRTYIARALRRHVSHLPLV
jgi:hypothetical protein